MKTTQSKKQQTKTTEAAEYKVNKAYVGKLVTAVMDAAKHADEGIRVKIVAFMGMDPRDLENAKEQFRAQCKSWLKEAGKSINPQSVYNRQSEFIGCLNGYQAYAGMTGTKKSHFEKQHAKITGYHQLVKFLRDTKRGKASSVKPEKDRAIKSAWKNHKRDAFQKAKNWLRYADTDSLLSLIDFAEALVEARKKGNVEKLAAKQRKAA